jgi:transposase
MPMKKVTCFAFILLILSSCSPSTTTTVVKPRYHRTWYKHHVYKKKWQVWRIKFQPEKQGVKKVKMRG